MTRQHPNKATDIQRMNVCLQIPSIAYNISVWYNWNKQYVKVDSLFGLYGISTFVGYLIPNPFLYKKTVLFQRSQSSIST